MFTISLIAPPGRLDPALVANLSSAWGAVGDIVWLSPDEAAEFPVASEPANVAAVRADIQTYATDVNCMRTESRKKALLLADMDSTMIEQECIDELAAEAGFGERVAAITARAMNGELNFEDALRERVDLLKGLNSGVIDTVLTERITLASGGRELVATMRANGAYTALVSGGFTAFTSSIADRLGFDENRANKLLLDGDALTGNVADPILGRDAKVSALLEISERLQISPGDAVAVGDGANDLGMLEAAGLGVALHAKPAVAEVAPFRVDHGDLTALLFLQGYSRDEFV